MKKEDNPMVKNYAYGGRVAAGSMEKPEKQMQEGGMVMKPREPYTTAEEERKRKVSRALRAYASLVTNASQGAVRGEP